MTSSHRTDGPPPFSLRWSATRAARLAGRLMLAAPHALRVARPAPATWAADRLTAACLGHATALLNVRGVTVLTDPALLDRVGLALPGAGVVGPRRVTEPALAVDELPRLDVIAISHAHADHMDLQTLARLPKDAVLVIPANTRDLVAGLGFADVREISVGEVVEVKGLRLEARRVKHYGRRGAWDRVKARGYHGFLFEKDGARAFFGGDTAHTTLDPVPGGVDLAILGIGGYDPYVWNHATPEQAWDMANQLGARALLPMHWATFLLSDEPVEDPIRRLLAAAGDEAHRVVTRTIGETFVVPA